VLQLSSEDGALAVVPLVVGLLVACIAYGRPAAQSASSQQVDRAPRPRQSFYRNGYRNRAWNTRVGEIPLKIPMLR